MVANGGSFSFFVFLGAKSLKHKVEGSKWCPICKAMVKARTTKNKQGHGTSDDYVHYQHRHKVLDPASPHYHLHGTRSSRNWKSDDEEEEEEEEEECEREEKEDGR